MEAENLLEKIRKESKKQGFSVKELAKKMGFTDTTLYNIFTMKQKLTVEMLLKFSETLDKHPDEWFTEQTKNITNESKASYENHNDCVERKDYEFLKQQIEVLNKIILQSMKQKYDDENRPTQALLTP